MRDCRHRSHRRSRCADRCRATRRWRGPTDRRNAIVQTGRELADLPRRRRTTIAEVDGDNDRSLTGHHSVEGSIVAIERRQIRHAATMEIDRSWRRRRPIGPGHVARDDIAVSDDSNVSLSVDVPANGDLSESIASVAAFTSFRRAIASGVCDRASACSRLVIGATASSDSAAAEAIRMSRRSAAKSGIGMPRTVALGPALTFIRVTAGTYSTGGKHVVTNDCVTKD